MKINKDNYISPIIFAGLMMISYVAIVLFCRGRNDFVHLLSDRISFPPMWIFHLIYIVTLLLSGAAAGLLINQVYFGGACGLQTENLFLKGAVFFVAVYFLSVLWSPLIFSMQMPIVSLIVAVMSLVFSIVCIVFWLRVAPLSALLLIPYIIWSAYLVVLNFIIIFTM